MLLIIHIYSPGLHRWSNGLVRLKPARLLHTMPPYRRCQRPITLPQCQSQEGINLLSTPHYRQRAPDIMQGIPTQKMTMTQFLQV